PAALGPDGRAGPERREGAASQLRVQAGAGPPDAHPQHHRGHAGRVPVARREAAVADTAAGPVKKPRGGHGSSKRGTSALAGRSRWWRVDEVGVARVVQGLREGTGKSDTVVEPADRQQPGVAGELASRPRWWGIGRP